MLTTRSIFTISVTNEFKRSDRSPKFDAGHDFRGTARQCDAHIREYRRISGGCDIAVRCSYKGQEIDQRVIRALVDDADAKRMTRVR